MRRAPPEPTRCRCRPGLEAQMTAIDVPSLGHPEIARLSSERAVHRPACAPALLAQVGRQPLRKVWDGRTPQSVRPQPKL